MALFFTKAGFTQPDTINYPVQTLPGSTPVKFAPDIITGFKHSPLIISPDGNEMYWVETDGTERIKYIQYESGTWSEPAIAGFVTDFLTSHNGSPVFSPDGERLYFNSDRPGGIGSHDVWYVQRDGNGWDTPVNIGAPYNTSDFDVSPVFTNDSTAYRIGYTDNPAGFTYSGGLFSDSFAIDNHPVSEWYSSVYISPDEEYVIFAGDNPPDLYIRFKNHENNWSDPINMGDEINTGESERFPVISPDGKYLFFLRSEANQNDYFWVSASLIDDLREEVLNIDCRNTGKINVYPNPAQSTIQIEYPGQHQNEVIYRIIDLNGKILEQGKLTGKPVDVSGLNTGFYMINLMVDEKIINSKIIVE